MYLLSDKASAIREVQRFLHFISDSRASTIPRVAVDGIYGEETRGAVLAFQEEYGLPTSGEVDRITFELLYSVFNELATLKEIDRYILTGKSFPFKLGDQSDDVLIINLLIRELEESYLDIGFVKRSNYFSAETEGAVKALQRIFTMEENGIVDELFYKRLKDEVDSKKRLRGLYR